MKNYTSETANYGTSTFLTIIQPTRNTTIKFDDKSYHMQKEDILLMREAVQWELTTGTAFVLNCTTNAFDALFYSQIADCRIIYDFLFTGHKREHLYFQSSKDAATLQMMNLLKQEIRTKDSYHAKMMHLYLTGLMTCLDRSRPRTLLLSNSTMVSQNPFGKMLEYMGSNYTDCTLEHMAEIFGYHPDYLSRKFKAITGESFNEKLLSMRMEKAEELLLTTDLTIEQISQLVGFHDKSWFQKKFKEIYNNTPSKYRKLHQNSL